MSRIQCKTLRANYGLDPFVQGDGYAYTLSQVRHFVEGEASLSPRERLLLDMIDAIDTLLAEKE